MDIDNIYQEMNDKNFRSLSDGLKLLRKETTNNLERLVRLEDTVAQLQSQVQTLQSQNAVVMGKAFGSGPTE